MASIIIYYTVKKLSVLLNQLENNALRPNNKTQNCTFIMQ